MSTRVWLRRAYEPPTRNDGRRVLVDRIWPRGVSRTDAQIDEWCRDLAPSDGLRRWFDHDPDRWEEFQRRYEAELRDRAEQVETLAAWTQHGRITLVYGARDDAHNNAVALRQIIESLPSAERGDQPNAVPRGHDRPAHHTRSRGRYASRRSTLANMTGVRTGG